MNQHLNSHNLNQPKSKLAFGFGLASMVSVGVSFILVVINVLIILPYADTHSALPSIAVFLSFVIFILGVNAFPLSIVGLVLSIIRIKRTKGQKNKFDIVGLVLSIIALATIVVGIIALIIMLIVFGFLFAMFFLLILLVMGAFH